MNVKIDLAGGSILEKIIFDTQKLDIDENKKLKTALLSDLKDISEDSQNLRIIDVRSSTVSWQSPEIAFYLVYNCRYAAHDSDGRFGDGTVLEDGRPG